ncbi:hypothetical protein [Streptomyces brasiliensis]|uniref:Transcription regulator HTH AraC- type ligand binding domain-containing protein n=1 Tax=Streptomyces brasiliensis TaxID=1954 RepID=A0A917UNC8_9ACTN|nr:hypothetical protein [Streptomyces brasiliensis]GGJ70301.1 hypothetical protein GCM10010121_096200 [Streptomyces brasiliensis]
MIKTIFRSEDLPPEERLVRFDELQAKSLHPMRVRSDWAKDFRATARELALAAVNVVELTCSSADVRRTSRLVHESDPELISVIFSLSGGLAVDQLGRDAALGRHDFAAYDSSRPFELRIAAGQDTATLVRAHVPRALLPLPPNKIDRILAVRLPGQEGVGALLTQFFTGLTADTASYRPADVPRLDNVALDLLTAALAHHVDAVSDVPPESHQRTLLLRVQAFVQQHLHEPCLTPGLHRRRAPHLRQLPSPPLPGS